MLNNTVAFGTGASVSYSLNRLYPSQWGVFPANNKANRALAGFEQKVKTDKDIPPTVGTYLWCTDVAGGGGGDMTSFEQVNLYKTPDGKLFIQEDLKLDEPQLDGHSIGIRKLRKALDTAYNNVKQFAAKVQKGDFTGLKEVPKDDGLMSMNFHTGDNYFALVKDSK